MLGNSNKTLNLYVNPSWYLAALLSGLHAGALTIILMVPISWGARAVLTVLIGLSAFRAIKRHALRRGVGAVQAVQLDESGDWRLSLGDRDTLGPCRLLAFYLHPWVIVVQLRCRARRLPVGLVLTADAVDAGQLRALRVRLGAQHGTG